jgi:heme-degrading monooxygenase HmoA
MAPETLSLAQRTRVSERSSAGPGFVVLYRWRLHPGLEQQFIAAWTRVSKLLLEQRGSLGSRLHRAGDGTWYSYAQWPSAGAREQAFALPAVDPIAGAKMREAIAESFPEIILESVADYLVAGSRGGDSGRTDGDLL